MRLPLFICLCCALATPAAADFSDICEDEDESLEARVSACQQVLQGAEDQAEALADIADVYFENDVWAEAIELFSQALEVNPEHTRALGRRGIAFEGLYRWTQAEEDFRRLIEVAPDNPWGYYRLGRRLSQSTRIEDSLEYLEAGIEIDPEYLLNYWQLGTALSRLNRDLEAAELYRRLSRIRPFNDDAHLRAYWRFEEARLLQEAAYHARIAYTLNPNDLSTRDWLIGHLGDAPAPDLEPYEWTMPSSEQTLRYFLVRAPVDERDEMTRAIEDMINFFGGQTYPVPVSSVIVQMPNTPFGQDATVTMPVIEAAAGEDMPPSSGAPRLYGMFPFFARPLGPEGPLVFAEFDEGDPSEIWPLTNGGSLSGDARYLVDCSAGRGFPYVSLGCLPGTEIAEAGTLGWSLSVTLDRIHVPMGIFTTFRIDVAVESSIVIFGQPVEVDFTESIWVAPELNTWVARISTAGDEYQFLQAMEVVQTE